MFAVRSLLKVCWRAWDIRTHKSLDVEIAVHCYPSIHSSQLQVATLTKFPSCVPGRSKIVLFPTTGWFKINLPLSESLISHKWKSNWRYLQSIIPLKEDLVKMVLNNYWCWKWNGSPLLTNGRKQFYMHAKSMESCWKCCIVQWYHAHSIT